MLGIAGAARAGEDIRVWSEPVTGSDTPWAIVESVVDAPPADVWSLVSRCADYSKHMPRIAASRELSREGDESKSFSTTCEVTADLPFPLSDLTSVSRADHTVVPGERYVRRWQMVRGDYDVNEGSWTLVALDGGKRTKATYRIRARPKIPLPDKMLASAQQGTLPDLMRSLRAHFAKR
jgi:ribosome-associated toxin RatA of RatAB toxin-antitoxin module